jgi:protocatechuate 3,4-dioxygenase beta subunit
MRAPLVSAACLLVAAIALEAQTVPGTPVGAPRPAQTTPARDRATPEAVPTGSAVIRGRVVVAGTGEPVRRAFVNLMGRGVNLRRSTSTDEQGRFEFRELPKGEFQLSASKSGFVNVQLGQRGPQEPGRPIQLGEGQLFEGAVIALPRGGVIAGRVTDEYGDPVADAMVNALQYRWTPRGRSLVPSRHAQTNDLGQFRLHGLPPGDYIVSTIYRGGGVMFDASEDPGTPSYAPTYYPGTSQAAEAVPISVRVGEETSAEFQLTPMRLARIRGLVLDSSGRPASPDTMVMAMPKDSAVGPFGGSMASGGRVQPDGTFTIAGLAPGVYRLTATTRFRSMGDAGDPQMATTEVAVAGGDVESVTLTLTTGSTAAGQIVIEGDATAIRPQALTVMAVPSDPGQGREIFSPPARVEDDLRFELKGLFGTRVLMPGGLPSGWYLKSVLHRGNDITDTGFDADGARKVTGLQVVVTDRTTVVTGGVANRRGEPVTDYTVVAFNEDPERWTLPMMRYVRTARSDQQGQFRIQGLPPGRYHVVALEFADTNEIMNPDVLGRLADEATSVMLAEGETRSVRLTLAQ